MKQLFTAALVLCCGALLAAAQPPSADEFVRMVRSEHPRLFITKKQIPMLRQRALTVCKEEFAQLKEWVDGLPDDPKFEFKYDVCSLDGKKITFKRLLNDQNSAEYAVKTTGGTESVQCALVYLVTQDKKYRDKALKYIKMSVDFCEYSRQSRILYAWYHFSRLAMFVAYDWIADTLTPAEKKALMLPYVDFMELMRKPGFQINQSSSGRDGTYGEFPLMYFGGIAMQHEGIDDARVEKQLKDGYNLFVKMMNFRDSISQGSGVLVSACVGYSFGAYPTSSLNFLLTLRSAADIDGTNYWSQPKDYANWFLWAFIKDNELYEYGIGDAFHYNNIFRSGSMYNYFAQIIHLFSKSDPEKADLARAAISMLNEKQRVLSPRNYITYILTDFDPQAKPAKTAKEIMEKDMGVYLNNIGLAIMRTGVGSEETYAAFKTGTRHGQHQHYDENSFVLYRKGFQAADTGSRGLMPHHKAYFPQTIAHNAILIRMDKEPLANYWYPSNAPKVDWNKVYMDGGQYRQLAGYQAGFFCNEFFTAVAGDATDCYSAKKCKEAVRIFVLVKPGYVIIYDRVESVTANQEKAFALQFTEDVNLLPGNLTYSTAGRGAMFTSTLLPQKAKRTLYGGPGKEFWSNGQPWPAPIWDWAKKQIANNGGKSHLGRWRLEVTPEKADKAVRFLHVLEPADPNVKEPSAVQLLQDKLTDGVQIKSRDGKTITVKFARTGTPEGSIRIEQNGKTLFNGALYKPVKIERQAQPKQQAQLVSLRDLARIDIQHNMPDGQLIYADKGNAVWAENPRWFGGMRGALTQFNSTKDWQTESYTLKVVKDGRISITFKGPDVRDSNGKFMERWIEFKDIKVNGKSLMPQGQTSIKVWHSKGFSRKVSVKNGELVKVEVCFRNVD